MNILLLVLGGVMAGIIIGYFVWGRKDSSSLDRLRTQNDSISAQNDSKEAQNDITDEKHGIIKAESEEKEKNMANVRAFVTGKDKITNEDIQALLNVSDATAVRYLDDLEKEGLLKQVGATGQSVYYIQAK